MEAQETNGELRPANQVAEIVENIQAFTQSLDRGAARWLAIGAFFVTLTKVLNLKPLLKWLAFLLFVTAVASSVFVAALLSMVR
jgi:hypothetical protein